MTEKEINVKTTSARKRVGKIEGTLGNVRRAAQYEGIPHVEAPPSGKLENIIACLHDNFAQLDTSLSTLLERIYQSNENSCEVLRADCQMTCIADFSNEGEGWINNRFQNFHEKLNTLKQVLF